MTYNKILVPYDNSKPSETALEHAIRIAKMSGISSANPSVSIILLHVVQQMPIPSTFGVGTFKSSKTGDMVSLEQYLKDIALEIKVDAKKMLDEKVLKYRNIENISLNSQVLIGDPSDEIIKFANSEKIDLIIMGTTGLTGLKKIIAIGSVARNVSEEANCPVMLVR
ncbi:MAG TPA: universal stress protein [Nitrososphaeraceae archaeon]|nr:universal stress protein [Nitrososphaeraceae archaeon]